MSTLILSKSTNRFLLENLFSGSQTGGVISNRDVGTIRIYGGVPPTPAEFASYDRTMLPPTALVTFSTRGLSAVSVATATLGSASIPGIQEAVAANSGTATWFIMEGGYQSLIMGDVSNTSGTGALRIHSTNIIAGLSYSMQELQIVFPTTYTIG